VSSVKKGVAVTYSTNGFFEGQPKNLPKMEFAATPGL